MPDIFSYLYPHYSLSLNHFMAKIPTASNLCWCSSTKEYTKEMFLKDYPQFAKIIKTQASSTFTRDPANTGGPNAEITFEEFNATVTGQIAWYPADAALQLEAGNYVGFEVIAPTDLDDISNGIFAINGGTPQAITEHPNPTGNPRIFSWYLLLTKSNELFKLEINWDGFGARPVETFTVNIVDVVLDEAPEEPEPINIALAFRNLTKADEVIESVIPDDILDMFIAMGLYYIQECRWGPKWRFAIGLYIAHYATLYLRSYKPASETNNPGSAAGSGGIVGVMKSAQLGDSSVQYDVSSVINATEDWGAFNSTVYGQLLVTEVRLIGLGGMYII